jgi:YVTN family beta-propeller protein
MRLPDPGRSRALVLGCSSYEDPALPCIPAVVGNRAGMKDVLTSPWGTGLAPEHCLVLEEADHVRDVIGSQLTTLAGEAEDMLLVYYAGHGLIGPNGELFLALPGTRGDLAAWTALPFDLVRSALAGAHARNRVLILDCCFSGLAINDYMSEVTSAVRGQLEVVGICTLASSPANRPSSAPPGEQYTAYTGELLDFIWHGSADQPELLTLTAIHEHLVLALTSRGLPIPEQHNTKTIGHLALARNRMWAPTAGQAHVGTRHSAPHSLRPAAARIAAPTAAVRFRAAAARRGASPIVLVIVAVIAALASSALVAYWPFGNSQPSSSPPVHAAISTITIGAGKDPWGVAVDPATGTAYVTNFRGNSVSVIDTATNTVTATTGIGLGEAPTGVAVDPATNTAYVTNLVNYSVSVIDTATNTATATISVGLGPGGVAVDPAATAAYVANFGGNSVSVINTATNAVTATIHVGEYPEDVAVDSAISTAYVTNSGGNSVSVIDTATNAVTATIHVGPDPEGVAVDPSTGTAYVAIGGGNSVSVINTRTNAVTATIGVGSGPWGVAVDPSTGTAYVTNSGGNSVSVIDTATNTVTATIDVGKDPRDVAVDPATGTAYVANLSSGSVSVIKS